MYALGRMMTAFVKQSLSISVGICLIALSTNLSAQIDVKLVGGVGLSHIKSTWDPINTEFSTHPAFSGSLGAEIDLPSQNSFSYGFGLFVNQYTGLEKSYNEQLAPNQNVFVNSEYTENITALGIPVFARLNVEKISVNVGLRTDFIVSAQGKQVLDIKTETFIGPTQKNDHSESETTKSISGLSSVILGFDGGVNYQLTDDFSIGINALLGLTNLVPDAVYEKYINQFTLRSAYTLK